MPVVILVIMLMDALHLSIYSLDLIVVDFFEAELFRDVAKVHFLCLAQYDPMVSVP